MEVRLPWERQPEGSGHQSDVCFRYTVTRWISNGNHDLGTALELLHFLHD